MEPPHRELLGWNRATALLLYPHSVHHANTTKESRMPVSDKKATKKPTESDAKTSQTFSAEEKSAMRQRAREAKAGEADGESEALAKIAEMSGPDRAMAERLHAIVKAAAPTLTPKTWYGMPAY